MKKAMKQLRDEFATTAVSGVSPLLLGSCSHLDDLDTRSLVRLSKLAECRLLHAGETIFEQGERADSVYLLLDGTIRLEHARDTGAATAYDVVAPYASFGDVVLLGERERRYTATASADSVVVEVPLRPLVDVLSANAPQALAWRGAVMARLHRYEPQNADTFAWRILDKLSQLFDAA